MQYFSKEARDDIRGGMEGDLQMVVKSYLCKQGQGESVGRRVKNTRKRKNNRDLLKKQINKEEREKDEEVDQIERWKNNEQTD